MWKVLWLIIKANNKDRLELIGGSKGRAVSRGPGCCSPRPNPAHRAGNQAQAGGGPRVSASFVPPSSASDERITRGRADVSRAEARYTSSLRPSVRPSVPGEMAKKSASRNALKSLFSRSEANLEESGDKDADKTGGEKKKFKFLKFKTKSKKGSASEKSADESPQVLSAVETNNAATGGEAWPGNAAAKSKDRKGASLYGTAPRSKSKEFSYSELDLRKPKKFATFSFGLRKRRKKDEENMSKSVVGLHSPDIEVREEAPLDLRPMELKQANTKTVFSMSQPELDTSTKFDIPSPPPVATNKPDSYFDLPGQSRSSVPQSRVTGLLVRGSGRFDVHNEARAPIASIPELQQYDDDDALNVPVQDNSSNMNLSSPAPVSATETPCAGSQTASSLPASHPAIAPETSDHKAALVDSVFTSSGPCNNDILEQSDTKPEIYQTESTSVTLSHHRPDASDTVDSTALSGDPFLTGVSSKIDVTFTESPPVSHNDKSALRADSASIHQEFSVSPLRNLFLK
ncbi:hypothetical protein Q5P01_018531 [Channa striata]|uniref:Uncharacterized protein n=1 Tax=Channa striata TaxID=64152 RepID=A0AA88S8D2_CHASR|nr:hypothetical protein Q5P01_018531 [Channa striata]